VTWGIDLADGAVALAIGVLLNHDQSVHHLSGRAIHPASESNRGEGRTDAKDAAAIVDRIRIRRDPHPLRSSDDTATESSTAYALNSPGQFPAWQACWLSTPRAARPADGLSDLGRLRRIGVRRPEAWLRNRKVTRAVLYGAVAGLARSYGDGGEVVRQIEGLEPGQASFSKGSTARARSSAYSREGESRYERCISDLVKA
jgi:hypothetical protein